MKKTLNPLYVYIHKQVKFCKSSRLWSIYTNKRLFFSFFLSPYEIDQDSCLLQWLTPYPTDLKLFSQDPFCSCLCGSRLCVSCSVSLIFGRNISRVGVHVWFVMIPSFFFASYRSNRSNIHLVFVCFLIHTTLLLWFVKRRTGDLTTKRSRRDEKMSRRQGKTQSIRKDKNITLGVSKRDKKIALRVLELDKDNALRVSDRSGAFRRRIQEWNQILSDGFFTIAFFFSSSTPTEEWRSFTFCRMVIDVERIYIRVHLWKKNTRKRAKRTRIKWLEIQKKMVQVDIQTCSG